MTDDPIFTSPEYPVLYTVAASGGGAETEPGAPPAHLSLALLVGGVPSFLATLPVDPALLAGVTASLDEGDVRVSVTGISVEEDEVDAPVEPSGPDADPDEPWRASLADFGAAPAGTADDRADGGDPLPGAYLGLVCADGRRLGVARIVSRDRRATPAEVARYVLDKITSGVQVPDLASAG